MTAVVRFDLSALRCCTITVYY